MKRAVITGIGAVAGNASGKEQLFETCTNGISGIKKCTAFNTDGLLTDRFGECELSEENRLYELIRLSSVEMLADAGVDTRYISAAGGRCRLCIGTLLSTTDNAYKHSAEKSEGISNSGSLASMNDYISYTKKIFGVKGSVSVSSAACASGASAAGMAFDYIRNGVCDMVVMGGADPLTITAAYGFNSLKSLSSCVCNPYDENRDGINIGECGAYFLVEELEHARERNARIYCEIAGYGLGNDAYHATSPDPEGSGAYNTMLMALADGKISADMVDYINGHGTGTVINDSMEVKAIERLFENTDKIPALSSTKAILGHCMGASGAIELASTIMSMINGKYIPMPRLSSPITDDKKIFISSSTKDIDIKYALSNSFAFAGNSASLLIKSYEEGE